MKIYLGADHRGFELKGKMADWLGEHSHDFEDLGAGELNPEDDYTTFAGRVASAVAENPKSLGILMCGSGVGVDVMANKFDGIRSSIGKNADQVAAGREDDDMNVLVIAADYTSESEAIEMIEKFIKTNYAKTKRYERRLADIKNIEKIN